MDAGFTGNVSKVRIYGFCDVRVARPAGASSLGFGWGEIMGGSGGPRRDCWEPQQTVIASVLYLVLH